MRVCVCVRERVCERGGGGYVKAVYTFSLGSLCRVVLKALSRFPRPAGSGMFSGVLAPGL